MIDDCGTSVYFAQCDFGGPIKIGHSHNRAGRIEALSKDLPFNLVEIGSIPGGLFRERFIQLWFRKLRIKGEWFQPAAPVMRWALQARTQGKIATLPDEPPRAPPCTGEEFRRLLDVDRIHISSLSECLDIDTRYFDVVILKQQTVSMKTWAAYAICCWARGEYIDWGRLFRFSHAANFTATLTSLSTPALSSETAGAAT